MRGPKGANRKSWPERGEGRGHGRRGREGSGLGRHGRFLDHGELRHVVLALLGEQPRHGYDIIRAIEQRTGGAYCPSPGVIYPTLQLLEDAGFAAPAASQATRNSYQITAKGRVFLDGNSALIGDIMSRVRQVGRSQVPNCSVVVAAMDNLKSALRGGAEPRSDALALDVAAAINSAADRIRALCAGSDKASKK